MAWAIISTLTSPTAGVFDFASVDFSTYKVIRVHLSGITVTTDGTDLRLTFYVGGSEVTSGYNWLVRAMSTGGTSNADSAATQASLLLTSNDANWDTGNASTESFGGVVTVDAPASTALHKKAAFEVCHVGPTGNAITSQGMGQMNNAGAITGLKIGGTSNLTAGKVRILGLA